MTLSKKAAAERAQSAWKKKLWTKLTPALEKEFYDKFRRGSTVAIAYRACGVSKANFFKWWNTGDPDGKDGKVREPFYSWRKECERLMAEVRLSAIEKVLHAHEEGGVGKLWPSFMTFLERQEPSDFGKKTAEKDIEKPIGIQIILGTQPTRQQIEVQSIVELPANVGKQSPD